LASDWVNSLDAQEKSILDDAKAELERERDLETTRLNNVLNLKLQYPNAGINSTDTLEEATDKVEKYQKTAPNIEPPKVIGSASTGYQQWNPSTGTWETIPGTGGGSISNEGNLQPSITLQRLLSGVGSINDLTQSDKKAVQNEAYTLGLYSNTVPEWFKILVKGQEETQPKYIQDPNNKYVFKFQTLIMETKLSDTEIKNMWDVIIEDPIAEPEDEESTEDKSIEEKIEEYLDKENL